MKNLLLTILTTTLLLLFQLSVSSQIALPELKRVSEELYTERKAELLQKLQTQKTAENYEYLMNLEVNAGYYDSSIYYNEKAIELAPNSAQLSLLMADVYHRKTEFEEAVKYYYQAFHLGYGTDSIFNNILICYDYSGNDARYIELADSLYENNSEPCYRKSAWVNAAIKTLDFQKVKQRMLEVKGARCSEFPEFDDFPNSEREFLEEVISSKFYQWNINFDEIEGLIGKAVDKYPDASAFLRLKAKLYIHKPGGIEEVPALLEKALRLDAKDHLTVQLFGSYYHTKRDLPKAKEKFEQVIKMAPNYNGGYNDLGIVYRDLGNDVEAEKNFLKSVELDSSYYEALDNLGNIYYRAGRPWEAIKYYNKVFKLEPRYYRTHFNYSSLLMSYGNNELTFYHAQKSYIENPSYKNAYDIGIEVQKRMFNRDRVCQVSQAAQANGVYMAPLDQAKNCPGPQNSLNAKVKSKERTLKMLGEGSYASLGARKRLVQFKYDYFANYDEIIKDLKQILKVNPNDFEASNFLGTIYDSDVYNPDSAMKYLNLTINNAKQFPYAKHYLFVSYRVKGNLLIRLNKLTEAQKVYEECIDQFEDVFTDKPNDLHKVYHSLGYVLYVQKQYSRAEKALEKALEISPINGKSLYYLAASQKRLNKDFSDNYLKLQTLDPSNQLLFDLELFK